MSTVTTVNTTWVTPRTWTTGELVTKSIMDTHVRDNLNAIKTPAKFYCVIDEVADYTIATTAWTTIDGTDLSATITTGGGIILCGFFGMIAASTTTVRTHFDVLVDGARFGGDDGLIGAGTSSTTSDWACVGFLVPITGLSAASHTFTLQWKNSTGTTTLHAGAGTSQGDLHPRFFGFELG